MTELHWCGNRVREIVAPLYHFEESTFSYVRRCLACDGIAEQITSEMVERMPWHLMSQMLQQAVTRRREATT